jgi:hypothetical protein
MALLLESNSWRQFLELLQLFTGFDILSQLSLRSRSRMVSSVPAAANTTAGRSG